MNHLTLADVRAQHSKQRLDQLRNRLQDIAILREFPSLTVYGVGSYARLEASEHSDLDLFFLTADDLGDIDELRTKSLRLFGEIIDVARQLNFRKFSNDTPRQRLESVTANLPEIADLVTDVLGKYGWFLEKTGLATADLESHFADKEQRTEMFRCAREYGDAVFDLLRRIDQSNSNLRLLRSLVV